MELTTTTATDAEIRAAAAHVVALAAGRDDPYIGPIITNHLRTVITGTITRRWVATPDPAPEGFDLLAIIEG